MRVTLCKSYQKKFDCASLNLKVLSFCMERRVETNSQKVLIEISLTSCSWLDKRCICILIDFFIDDSDWFDFQINVEKAHNKGVRTRLSSIAAFGVKSKMKSIENSLRK